MYRWHGDEFRKRVQWTTGLADGPEELPVIIHKVAQFLMVRLPCKKRTIVGGPTSPSKANTAVLLKVLVPE